MLQKPVPFNSLAIYPRANGYGKKPGVTWEAIRETLKATAGSAKSGAPFFESLPTFYTTVKVIRDEG
jgi:hypothetical protein